MGLVPGAYEIFKKIPGTHAAYMLPSCTSVSQTEVLHNMPSDNGPIRCGFLLSTKHPDDTIFVAGSSSIYPNYAACCSMKTVTV